MTSARDRMAHGLLRRGALAWMLLATPAAAVLGAEDPEASPPPEETAADAAAAEPRPAAGPAPIEITGFLDAYYGYNFNEPSGDGQLRNFDTKHDQLSLGLIEIALEQKPTAASRLGFRADLDFGPVTDLVHAAEPGGADVFKSFEQAYVSYLAPLGGGLQIDAGKFVTPHGAEVIEAKDDWNYSRSLLFALAIPYYHVGVRAACPVGHKLTLAGYFVNGWNNGVDNNDGKTFGFQAVVKPTSKLTLVQNVMTGPEQADDADGRRFLSDSTLTVVATPWLSFMANYDHGRDRLAGADVTWQGIAVYARVQVNDWWAIAPRLEWLDDSDGFMTGTSQTLRELTLTSEQKVSGGLLTRLELRRDFSDEEFFVKAGAPARGQTTLTFGLVYGFASKF